jgi:hypothetical protein
VYWSGTEAIQFVMLVFRDVLSCHLVVNLCSFSPSNVKNACSRNIDYTDVHTRYNIDMIKV